MICASMSKACSLGKAMDTVLFFVFRLGFEQVFAFGHGLIFLEDVIEEIFRPGGDFLFVDVLPLRKQINVTAVIQKTCQAFLPGSAQSRTGGWGCCGCCWR